MVARFPVFPGQSGQSQLPPGPLPDDARAREALLSELFPAHVVRGAVVDVVSAPAIPTAAQLDSAAENFNLSGGGSFEFLVDGYEGVKPRPGTAGVLKSAKEPATSITGGTDDNLKINIAGDGAQEVSLGTQSSGADVASALQTQVRALTANNAENQQAIDGFTATYSAPTFSRLLKAQITSGAAVDFVTLDDVSTIRRGDTLKIRGTTDQTIVVKDIDYSGKRLRVGRFTAGETYAVNSVVSSADDFYKLTTGKFGADMTIDVTDGSVENGADDLKLRDADGAVETVGTDALGRQSISYSDSDFSSPAAATAAEVVVVLNKSLTGAIASVSGGKVRLTSRTLGVAGRLQALAGDAINKLGYAKAEQVGTETDMPLSLDSPDIIAILPFTESTGALGNLIHGSSVGTTVRTRRDKLENISGTDHSNGGDGGWVVVSKPAS